MHPLSAHLEFYFLYFSWIWIAKKKFIVPISKNSSLLLLSFLIPKNYLMELLKMYIIKSW